MFNLTFNTEGCRLPPSGVKCFRDFCALRRPPKSLRVPYGPLALPDVADRRRSQPRVPAAHYARQQIYGVWSFEQWVTLTLWSCRLSQSLLLIYATSLCRRKMLEPSTRSLHDEATELHATIISENSTQVDFPVQKIVLHSSLISSRS